VFGDPALVVYPPDRVFLRSAVDKLLESGFRDLEGMFYQVLTLAHAGDSDRAVEILADVVDRGFYPYQTFASHAWLDALRERQDFKTILEGRTSPPPRPTRRSWQREGKPFSDQVENGLCKNCVRWR